MVFVLQTLCSAELKALIIEEGKRVLFGIRTYHCYTGEETCPDTYEECVDNMLWDFSNKYDSPWYVPYAGDQVPF